MIFNKKRKNDTQIVSKFSLHKFKAKKIHLVVSLFLAILFSVFSLSSLLVSGISYADGNSDLQDKLGTAASDYSDGKSGEEGFEAAFDKYLKNPWNSGDSKDSFSYVIKRVLSPGYINETEKSVVQPDKNYWCDVNDKYAGTASYHNCDVPNIMTEFLQSIVSLSWRNTESAEVSSAKVNNPWFGLPSNIPNNNVPTNSADRSVKYTALELYGYSLKYTSYNGEWDNIKVMTSARAMSNFGLMDNINLSVSSLINGIGSGINDSLGDAWSQLSQGRIISSVGAMFTGIFEHGISGGINTILDSSDANVFNTGAWYRVGYGATVYNGARELTNAELSIILQKMLLNYIAEQYPDEAKPPEDLMAIKTLTPPLDEIGHCEVANVSGGTVGDYTTMSSIKNSKDCSDLNSSTRKARWIVEKQGQTLSEWKDANKDVLATGEKYDIQCSLNTSGDKNSEWTSFNTCWSTAWTTAYDNAMQEASQKVMEELINNKILDPSKMMAELQKKNFNTPQSRYVCSPVGDPNIKYVFKENGELTGDCNPMRPPIQNGFFGNGYTESTGGTPQIDTRWAATSSTDPISVIFSPAEFISNAGLSTSVFFTQMSNTVLNLSFSPLMETIGLDKIVVSLITGLRDSLFFPLAVAVIAISALWQMINTFKSKNYNQGFISIALIAGTFMLGVFLMAQPAAMVKAIDDVPSQIELTILGTIYNTGANADPICEASSTTTSAGTGIDGQPLTYNPKDSLRIMMCQVWEVFSFDPWVYGQFGTNYQDLNTSAMQNKNSNLVGDASVNLGGNNIVKNWALYQLETTTSGTSTTDNPKDVTGRVDSDFYRLVDLQAGPNNGANSDSRYFATWSGNDWGGRLMVALFAPIISIIGFITIASLTIAKILISLKSLILLVIMPIMFLYGLHPTKGRNQLRRYGMTLLGLFFQRILLVLFLAVFLKILVAFALTAQSYPALALTILATCILFLIYKDELFEMVSKDFDTSFGGNRADPAKMFSDVLPKSVRNYTMQMGAAAKGTVAGTVGGFMAGGIGGARRGAQEGMALARNRMRLSQRRKGFGALQNFNYASDAAVEDVKKDLRGGNYDKVRDDYTAAVPNGKDIGEDLRSGGASSSGPRALGRTPQISPKEAKLLRKLKDLERDQELKSKESGEKQYRKDVILDTDPDTVRKIVEETKEKGKDDKNSEYKRALDELRNRNKPKTD